MSKRKKSVVWDYFEENDEKVVCNECKKLYSKGKSTTVLKKHLDNDHKIDFGEKK